MPVVLGRFGSAIAVGLAWSLGFLAEGVVVAHTVGVVTLPAIGWTVVMGVGIVRLGTFGVCGQGVLVN